MTHRISPLVLAADAVQVLAIGEHGIKQRLLAAYVQKLQHIHNADVPAELLPALTALQKRLGHRPDQPAGRNAKSAEAALARMTVPQAVKLARGIVEFNAVFAGSLYH